jgi:hypothetical protein
MKSRADTSRELADVFDETFGSVPEFEVPERDEWDRDADPRD